MHMKIYSEISLENFEAWSGAVNTLDRIRNARKCDLLESILEDAYPDGLSETALNDILWFEPDWCYEMCGMRSESEIREELEEAREELANLKDDFEEAFHEMMTEELASTELIEIDFDEIIEGMDDLNAMREDLWNSEYKDEVEELEEKIKELEEELEDIF